MADLTCKDHTECPKGYIQWHCWAEKKTKTHKQIKCPECGKLSIWIKKEYQGEHKND